MPSPTKIEQDQQRVVRHVAERPDEDAAQRRGQQHDRPPPDLVGEPAHHVVADQDPDPDLEGVDHRVLERRDQMSRLPDERVQRPGDPVRGQDDGPCHLSK